MGRARRNSYAGAFFHVGTRGNRKGRIYEDAIDRIVFLSILERCVEKYEWLVYSWCLMTTHYHLVLRVPIDGLSAGMRELNGGFARWSNARHERIDHVFGRRFFANELVGDAQLLHTCRYVLLNPVRAGVCTSPEEWRWSSYRATVGDGTSEPRFACAQLLAVFAGLVGTRPEATPAAFRRFVEAGRDRNGHVPVPGTDTRM